MKPAYIEGGKAAGYKVCDWNVDSKDWLYKDARLVDNTINFLIFLGASPSQNESSTRA